MSDLVRGVILLSFGVLTLALDIGRLIVKHSARSKLFLLKHDGAFSSINIAVWRLVGVIACIVGIGLVLKDLFDLG